MANLTQASRELFSRSPDERFETIEALWQHCQTQRELSRDRWQLPQTFRPHVHGDRLGLALGDDGAFLMNDWSFSSSARWPIQHSRGLAPRMASGRRGSSHVRNA